MSFTQKRVFASDMAVEVNGMFTIGASGAITANTTKGDGFTVARSAAGTYVVTLADWEFTEILDFFVSYLKVTGTTDRVQPGAYDLDGAGAGAGATFTFYTTNSAGTIGDLASGEISFRIVGRAWAK
jgi:hypothetical protein